MIYWEAVVDLVEFNSRKALVKLLCYRVYG